MTYPTNKSQFTAILAKLIGSKPDMAFLSVEEMTWLETWLADPRVNISTGPGLPDQREYYVNVLAWNRQRLKDEAKAKKQLGRPKQTSTAKRRKRVAELHHEGKDAGEIARILKLEGHIAKDKCHKKAYDIVTQDIFRTNL